MGDAAAERRQWRRLAVRRRTARGSSPVVLYADASLRKHSSKAVAAVTTIDKLVTSSSIRTTYFSQAEEVTIALALTQGDVQTIVTDSKTAYGNYRKGVVSHAA